MQRRNHDINTLNLRNVLGALVLSLLLVGSAPAEVSSETLLPSQNRISLELKGMEISEVLHILSNKASMNLVIGGNVQGRVTLYLKDVEIQDAFDIILLSNGLAYDRRGDIVYVMLQQEYEEKYGERFRGEKSVRVMALRFAKAEEVAKALGQVKSRTGKVIVDLVSNTVVLIDNPKTVERMASIAQSIDVPTVTRIFELRYAKAKDLKDKIQERLTKDLGLVSMDERTNHLVVTEVESKMPIIEQVIARFDDKPRQVMIDAKIVQVTLSDEYKLGVDWQGVFESLNRTVDLSSTFRLQTAGSMSTSSPGIEAAIGTFDGDDYAMLIQALKKIGDTNTLSSPQITAISNQEAKILVGESRPYAVNTVAQNSGVQTIATTLSFIETGVKLYVTPTINQDGFVTMKIRPEVSSVSDTPYTYGDPETEVPIVSTTQAETSVTVKDGKTIIIAGLIKDERSGEVNKIPGFGDIPLLGNLFRKTDNSIGKTELVIFLTPHVISGSENVMERPASAADRLNKFTVPEFGTFERRDPEAVDPTLFKKGQVTAAKAPRVAPSAFSTESIAGSSEEYYYDVKNRILNHLELKKTASGVLSGRIKLSFTLASTGELRSGPEVMESSNEDLNAPVVDAVRIASPFAPFPPSLRQAQKTFTIDFVFE